MEISRLDIDLSGHLFFCLGPGCWRELLDLGDFGCGQVSEHIFQIIRWVDALPPTSAQQSVMIVITTSNSMSVKPLEQFMYFPSLVIGVNTEVLAHPASKF
jgi:hypothetical protein